MKRFLELGFLTTRIREAVAWARGQSLWACPVANACCAGVAPASLAASGPRFAPDLAVLRCSPRHADLLIVAARPSLKMAPLLREAHASMLQPRWTIALGACAASGGPFDTYAVIQGIERLIPVDVTVPGCPPSAEALLEAVLRVRDLAATSARKGRT